MEAATTRPVEPKSRVAALAGGFVSMFPDLNAEKRRVAVQTYRLLARGGPVGREELAEAAGVSLSRLNEMLDGWSGIFYEEEAIIGFWGLTPRPFSKHLFAVEGRTLYAWCAWDTLFMPRILGKTAQVESTDPETGSIVRMTVTPDEVHSIEPSAAVMSILEPKDDMMEDLVSRLCHFIYFFPSREIGEAWAARNPGCTLLTVQEGFELGRLKNEDQFGEALRD
ncbi:MAG: organomercurial lyase [SAR324 cluster bacterium]|nr:organomercurial lyase [SAR324 cluster bacterium]